MDEPIEVSTDRRVSLPMVVLVALLGASLGAGTALAAIQSQLNRNTSDIASLQQRVDGDHDLIVEINTNVKRLIRLEKSSP